MISPKVVTARWLLLCALAFGLVGMHHLGWMSHPCGAPAETMASMSDVTPGVTSNQTDVTPGGQAPGHGTHHGIDNLLHLCLAVLAAGLVLIGLWAQWRRQASASGDTRIPRLPPWRQPPHRPPVPSSLLTSLGVLRL
jgi:hypothetical protein